jgi:hypothetical protein
MPNINIFYYFLNTFNIHENIFASFSQQTFIDFISLRFIFEFFSTQIIQIASEKNHNKT